MAVCYRHPSRETGVSCSSCGRPICPDCMTPTSVGMRCPECAGERTRVRRLRPRAPQARYSAWQVLIAINVLVFLAELATGVTLGGRDSGAVYWSGLLYGPALTGHDPASAQIAQLGTHQYWRLLTSGFIHLSLIHIGLNMISLWFVGRALEPAIGSRAFLAVYFASLLAGSFGALLFSPDVPSAGASTAIFGIFGALIVFALERGIPFWQSGLGPILLLNLLFSVTDANISLGGHVGGLLGGLICGLFVVRYLERHQRPWIAYGACLAVAVVSVVGAIAVAGGHGLVPNGISL